VPPTEKNCFLQEKNMKKFLVADKEYKIVQSSPHLLVRGENNKLLLIDTSFNGAFEEIADLGEKAIWIGSKYIEQLGSCLDVNYAQRKLVARKICTADARRGARMSFGGARSCSGLAAISCPLGQIVSGRVAVYQGQKRFAALAFFDTGSPHSVVLRSKLKQNQFRDLKLQECTSRAGTQAVTIDGQNILLKPRDISLSFLTDEGGEIKTNARRMSIACGLKDRVASETYNRKLSDVGLGVEATVGNDALAGFSRVVFDYGSKNIFVFGAGVTSRALKQASFSPSRALRQQASFSTSNVIKLLAIAGALVVLNGTTNRMHRRLLLGSILGFFLFF